MTTPDTNALLNPARLSELLRLQLLDTPCEVAFDRLTRLAARALKAPIALVSLVDDHRQFFKSAYGLPEPWATRRETPLSHSFCKHVVAGATPLVIDDARTHPLVRNNGAVKDLCVIAYLGIPMITPQQNTIGSFCVIDTLPRHWTDDELSIMTDLAAAVMSEIALRVACGLLQAVNANLQREVSERVRLLDVLHDADGMLATAEHLAGNGSFTVGRPHSASLQDSADVLNNNRDMLTKRQRDVFDLLVQGLQTKEVAQQLGLSPRTVDVHRAKILERLHIRSVTQLLRQILEPRSGH